MSKYFLHKPALLCSLGENLDEIAHNLFFQDKQYLTSSDKFSRGKKVALGMVAAELPDLLAYGKAFQSRNNCLLAKVADQLRDSVEELKTQFPPARIGIVVGSSTSGILEGESAQKLWLESQTLPDNYCYQQQEIGAPSEFLAHYLDIRGPAYTISTACSSGAKALASARRLLALGVCDAVVCGGADSLCELTVNGFMSLEAVSAEPCLPFKKQRCGINIGEGACLFVMTRSEGQGFNENTDEGIYLAGVGESSDAYHISAPEPGGSGAIAAMQAALTQAGIAPEEIAYINLHGTATEQNDQMESVAVHQVFGSSTPCSSTKALVGHTLGAAGALEAGFCWLVLNQSQDNVLLPPQAGAGDVDSELAPIRLVKTGEKAAGSLNFVLSNSFAFGGNNIALVLGRT